ncbi:MAG TPA: DUF4846 domain-containing protein [Ferruginibacter sp.]|nr:DUF4846 domain-containing protein [Ferruginibacter sp.]
MRYKALFIFSLPVSFSCADNSAGTATNRDNRANSYLYVKDIPLPEGFSRTAFPENSFAGYLRNTGLKKSNTVYLFNGQPKINQSAQFAVLNISVGQQNLQQCADAVMRLRAEYLFKERRFEQILFFDNDHAPYLFSEPYTRSNFNNYLNRVFGMCGSASLAKQLNPVAEFSDIKPGDVLIRGGFPGHAALVMDVAVNEEGKRIFLLAQSYMPAQDIHILKNPANPVLSPWYQVNDTEEILTPEYLFKRTELMRW